MVHKESGEQNQADRHRLHGFPCGMRHHQACRASGPPGQWSRDAHKKVYVLDGNVPILVSQTTMDETLDVEAKSHVEMFHHYFFTLAPDDKYIRYTMEKAMYLVDETGLHNIIRSKRKVSTATFSERARCSPSSATASDSMQPKWSSPTTDGSASNVGATS